MYKRGYQAGCGDAEHSRVLGGLDKPPAPDYDFLGEHEEHDDESFAQGWEDGWESTRE